MRVQISFRDGLSINLDFRDESERKQWEEFSVLPDFQDKITAVCVVDNQNNRYVFPTPRIDNADYKWVIKRHFSHKKNSFVGIKIVCEIDSLKLTMIVDTEIPGPRTVVRTTLSRPVRREVFPGVDYKNQFNPEGVSDDIVEKRQLSI